MKTRRFLFFLVFGLLIMSIIAVAIENYYYNNDIRPVLDNKSCTSCHSFAQSYSALVSKKSSSAITRNLPLINPGNPDSSVIIWRLKGSLPSGVYLRRMPVGGEPMDESTIDVFRSWINERALETAPQNIVPSPWGEIRKLLN